MTPTVRCDAYAKSARGKPDPANQAECPGTGVLGGGGVKFSTRAKTARFTEQMNQVTAHLGRNRVTVAIESQSQSKNRWVPSGRQG